MFAGFYAKHGRQEDMKKATSITSCNFTKFYLTESNTDYIWLYYKKILMKQLSHLRRSIDWTSHLNIWVHILDQTEEWYGGWAILLYCWGSKCARIHSFWNVLQSLLRAHSPFLQISISFLEIFENCSRWPSLFLGSSNTSRKSVL